MVNSVSNFRIAQVGPAVAAIAMALFAGLTLAATPPARVNYQGVLRDPSTGTPMSGAYDASFRFYSAPTGGDQILVDNHAASANQGLSVANGLFSVHLGGGAVTDGSGPGTYASLDEVFRDYGAVWMEIEIQGQVLSPRVNVISSPYALNATNLEGKPASSFLDTSSSFQAKNGPVFFNASSEPAGYAVQAVGPGGGLVAYDSDGGSGFAQVGSNDYGIQSYGRWGGGTGMAGWFKETTASGEAWLAPGDTGLIAFGSAAGGIFRRGVPSSYSDQASLASSGFGIDATGSSAGGRFSASNGSSSAHLGSPGYGVKASGNIYAGHFHDPFGGNWVLLSSVGIALDAAGKDWGGRFYSWGSGGIGVEGSGVYAGGSFYNYNVGDVGSALLGLPTIGIHASGSDYAGSFAKSGSSGQSSAYLANGWGVQASGRYDQTAGGARFSDQVYSGMAQLGRADAGIVSHGFGVAGIFRYGSEFSWSTFTHIAEGSSSVIGNGSKNFIQNHPYDAGAEIIYTALEGDEVGTYTRGSAVLEQGIARVRLSQSFAWVTNPDIGLTATVTPRGEAVPLAVESVSTSELVVRAPAGARDIAFDYLVQGLRIGFERASVVRPKRGDAPIPPMNEHAELYATHPELAQYSAFSRFEAMEKDRGGVNRLDHSRGEALVAAIGVGDMTKPPVRRPSLLTPEHAAQWVREHPGQSLAEFEARPSLIGKLDPSLVEPPSRTPVSVSAPVQAQSSSNLAEQTDQAASPAPRSAHVGVFRLPVAEAVEQGDVLVNDGVRPGSFVRARESSDPGVIGIVTGEPGSRYLTEAPVALAGMMVLCKVDATQVPIEANDLLMASSLAGHAMHAGDNPRQGTVIGKALEPLSEGTGLIKVLVMSR